MSVPTMRDEIAPVVRRPTLNRRAGRHHQLTPSSTVLTDGSMPITASGPDADRESVHYGARAEAIAGAYAILPTLGGGELVIHRWDWQIPPKHTVRGD